MTRVRYALGAAATLIALPTAALAQEGRFSTDVSATAGYSNNPFTEGGGSTGSAVLSLDVLPRYQWLTARSTTTLSGAVSLQQYLKRYPLTDSYSGAIDYSLRASERVTGHASLNLSSSVLGAFNSYLPVAASTLPVGSAPGVGTVPGDAGAVAPTPIPAVTSFPALTDIGLFGSRSRRRLARLGGDISATLSARDSLTSSAFFEASRYSRTLLAGDYEGYGGSVGYSRRVSERFTLGVRASGSYYNYRRSDSDSRVVSLEGTFSGQLSELWTVDGALGASFVNSGSVGSTRRTSLSGNLNVCRRGELSLMCAQISRQVSPTGLVGSQYVTSAGLNWSKQLGPRENLSLSGYYSKIGDDRARLLVGGQRLQTEYVQGVVGYDRQLKERLRFVASANYRQLLDGGAGRAKDYGGQVGLSYRFGDTR